MQPQNDIPSIKTHSDITRIPAYTEVIDPNVSPLAKIICHYFLPVPIACGLKSCRTQHNDGFLVLTEDGHVTNVGHICGKQFGETFGIKLKAYEEQERRPKAIATINEFRTSQGQALQAAFKDVASECERLASRMGAFRKTFPKLTAELRRRHFSGDLNITVGIERSKEEMERLRVANPGVSSERFRYREEVVGVIGGSLAVVSNLRQMFNIDLNTKLDTLLSSQLGDMKMTELTDWERWINSYEHNWGQVNSVMQATREFLAFENFRSLEQITKDSVEKRRLSSLKPEQLDLIGDGVASPTQAQSNTQAQHTTNRQSKLQERLLAKTLKQARRFR